MVRARSPASKSPTPWAARHKVIIPYIPNFGKSGDDPALDTVEDYVLHYMDLFDRLGLKKLTSWASHSAA